MGEFDSVMFWINTRLQPEGENIRGRGAFGNGHHGAPWPSIAPGPLISMSCRLVPEMNVVPRLVPPGYMPSGSIRRIAPASTWRLTELFKVNGPQRKTPGGISTVPPAAPLVIPPEE